MDMTCVVDISRDYNECLSDCCTASQYFSALYIISGRADDDSEIVKSATTATMALAWLVCHEDWEWSF